MIEIDGSEGGGQILRSALTLSLITGQAFRITHIRAQRSKPGLGRQHLACVESARAVCAGSADGAELNARELAFRPGPIRGGEYRVRISTAGSTTLVLQTLLLALLRAPEPSVVVIEGGTHNPMAPIVPFLQDVYLPCLTRMGARVELVLDRYGFAPAGGGQITARIEPSRLTPIAIEERGPQHAFQGRIFHAHLDDQIAQRERNTLAKHLGWDPERIAIETITDSAGPGNVVTLGGRWESISEWVATFGACGRTAEAVARAAAREFTRYLESEAPVGRHLADQLLLPFALAGAGRFRTLPVSDHFETNRRVIEAFLPVSISTAEAERSTVMVAVGSP